MMDLCQQELQAAGHLPAPPPAGQGLGCVSNVEIDAILTPEFLAEAVQLPASQHFSSGQGPQHVPVT